MSITDGGSTITNNFRFPGQYNDAESGLHYNYHRYYDPNTGRYVTSDPSHSLGNGVPFRQGYLALTPQKLHHYLYAQNNPIIFFDPNGLISISGNCDCNGDKDKIKTEAQNGCNSISSTITDPNLRTCMQNRCENAKINCKSCKDPSELGSNQWFLGIFPLKSISVCTNNPNLLSNLKNVLLHEWAHSCGWDHYQGGGVPGQSGSL